MVNTFIGPMNHPLADYVLMFDQIFQREKRLLDQGNTSLKYTRRERSDLEMAYIGRYLSHHPSLISVDFSFCSLSSRQLKILAEGLFGTTFTEFNLYCNLIGDDGVKGLAEVLHGTHITNLNLRANSIRDSGIKALADALPRAPITRLTLAHNNIGDLGAEALLEVLLSTRIAFLDLRFNKISVEMAERLRQQVALANRHLELLVEGVPIAPTPPPPSLPTAAVSSGAR